MRKQRHIVIIDDSAVVLEHMKVMLEHHGFSVCIHQDARQLGLLLVREQPDAVLLDVHMPGVATETIVNLISKYAHAIGTALILFSDLEPLTLAQTAVRCRANGWISKGRNEDAMIAELDEVLALRRHRRDKTALRHSFAQSLAG